MPFCFSDMKRTLFIVFPLLVFLTGFRAEAQVYFISDDIFQGRHAKLTVEVLDSLSKEPIPYASVYLVAKGDTVITNFTLSDDKGKAELSDIPYGNYVLFAEFMGYKAYSKEHYFRKETEDLGKILMQPDAEALEAARVSDIANPIVVKKDTLEYNAAAFATSRNATLGDLLKKMPGFEVGKDGSLKNNGKEVSKITVGGRTFFFDDKSVALSNIPAVVVDKVKVIDRKPESEQATDIESTSKERIVDIALKKEYEEGWFGNAALYGGAALPGDDEQTIPPDRDALYNAHLLAAYYNKEDQITLIGNSMNAQAGEAGIIVFRNVDDISNDTVIDLGTGLQRSNQVGVNVNTTKIKGFESTGTISFNDGKSESASKTSRTTFRDDGDLDYNSDSRGESGSDALRANFELTKTKTEKTTLIVRPAFSYTGSSSFTTGNSLTTGAGSAFVNSSSSNSFSKSGALSSSLYVSFGIKNLGKEFRALTFSNNTSLGSSKGDAKDYSVTTFLESEVRDLYYRNNSNSTSDTFTATYVEPIAEKWRLQMSLNATYSHSERTRDAFGRDDVGIYEFGRTFDDKSQYTVANDYYSSWTDNTSKYLNTRVLAQYRPTTQSTIQAGVNLFMRNVETLARNYGLYSEVGKGDWTKGVSPYLNFNFSKDNFTAYGNYSGSMSQPSNSNLTPVVNVGNPTRVTSGNIYLKPYVLHNSYVNLSYNEPASQMYFSGYLSWDYRSNGIVNATWYDTRGAMYSVPVNADRPFANIFTYASFNKPIDKKKIFRISGSVNYAFTTSPSYQRISATDPVNLDEVVYGDFIKGVWGNDASGDDFYNGKTGFSRNVSRTDLLGFSASFRMNYQKFSLMLDYSYSGSKVRSSLYESYNEKYADHSVGADMEWMLPGDFELTSDAQYVFYTGRRSGFDHPSFIWNAEVNKNIGAFTLIAQMKDILAQGKSFSHSANANFVEDSIRMTMGRYFLIGVKYNFGKMSPVQSSRAQTASLNML